MSNRGEFEMLVHAAIDRFGSCDVPVNNAAVAIVKPVGEVTEYEFEQRLPGQWEGNFNGCELEAGLALVGRLDLDAYQYFHST